MIEVGRFPDQFTEENEMANPDFMSFNVRGVEFMYPKLDSTYRYIAAEKRSDKCAQTAQGAKWSVTFAPSKAEGEALLETLKKHYAECRVRDAKRPAFGRVFGSKVLDDGRISFSASRNGQNARDELNPAPEVVDAKTLPLENRAIWTGSTGNLILSAVPQTDPDGVGGIKLLLTKVQVVNPVYGSAGAGFKDESANVVEQAPADSEFG